VDALCAIGEALLRPNAPALTTKMCKGLRRYMRDLLTPPQNRARLLSLRDDKDAAKSAEFAASSKTAQQRSQRRKNDRIREQRRAAAVAEMLDWEQFYAQHGLTWNELDTAAVQRVLTRLRLTGTGERGQHNTVARRSSAFNEHLNWAVRRGYITTNPSLLLEPEDRNPISVRATAPDLRLIVNLTVGFRLIAAAERLKLAPVGGAGSASGYAVVVALMLLAGLRPAEVRGLRRQNLVNLPESGWGMIVLEFGQSSPGQRYTPDGAVDQQVALKHAGERKTRPVPVPPTLVKLLRALLAAQDLAPDAWLFTAADSKPIPDRHLYEYWNLAKAEVFTDPADRLLLQNMRPYDLRHARASHLLAVGQHLPEAVIASWLGHTVETLRNTYQGVVNVGNEHWEQERTQYLEDLVPEQYRRSPDGSAKSDTDIDDRSLALLQAFQNLGEMEQRMLSDMMKALAKG
jgi:integrase